MGNKIDINGFGRNGKLIARVQLKGKVLLIDFFLWIHSDKEILEIVKHLILHLLGK